MSTLLHIDSSPLGPLSISRHLSAHYVEIWKKVHSAGQVITRDLTTSPLSVIDAAWIGASYTPLEDRTAEQKKVLAFSDTLIAELREADEYVLGVPMHNFSVPGALKLWIDQIARAGETFSYSSAGPVGLLENKKATFIIASGGVYDEGAAMASYDFVAPYLRTAFGFLGVVDIRLHQVGGAGAIARGQADREEFLKLHAANIEADFQVAA